MILASVVLLLVAAFVGISAYFGYTLTRAERDPVVGSPADFGLPFEDVTFQSVIDHLELSGWFIPAAGGGRVIILVHGEKENRTDSSIGLLSLSADLVRAGYNVLTFDLRGHGQSQGNMISGGYFEQRDLIGAVNYLEQRGFTQLGVIGFSMGATTAMLAAENDHDIKAVVEDSGYGDLTGIMRVQFAERSHGAPDFLLNPILFFIKLFYGVNFADIRPIAHLDRLSPRPLLIIQGDADSTVPVEQAYRLHAAYPRSTLWVLPNVGHVEAFNTFPREYVQKVSAFFNAVLK